MKAARAARADGDRDRNRPGARGERHRQGVEGEPARRHVGRARVRRLAAALFGGVRLGQHAPARHRHDDAAGDPQHRDRDAEEAEHVGADVQRRGHDAERVDRDPARYLVAHLRVESLGGAEEDERSGQRIDDRKQRAEREQERGQLSTAARRAASRPCDRMIGGPMCRFHDASRISGISNTARLRILDNASAKFARADR